MAHIPVYTHLFDEGSMRFHDLQITHYELGDFRIIEWAHKMLDLYIKLKRISCHTAQSAWIVSEISLLDSASGNLSQQTVYLQIWSVSRTLLKNSVE